jgi:predicted RND superfamily exporter protein
MKAFSRLVIRYRWLLLVAMMAATAGFGYEIRNMTSNYEYESWLPEGDEVAERVREVDKEFSATMVMFAILDFGQRGVFHPESLLLVQQITGELEGTEGLFQVISLLNVIDIRKIDDGIQVGDLIQEIPDTDDGMTELKEYVLGQERYVDSIVSRNARFTALIIHIDSAYDELKVAGTIIERVKGIAGDQPCYFGGDPAVAHFMNQYSNQDFKRLVPAMLAVMVLVLGFGLRRALGVVLPLSFVMICIGWTFGLKAILDYPFNMLSPPVAVMLIAIGSDYAVHIYNHFLRRRDIVLSMSEITPPVVMSALTTVIGLLTFSVTGIPNLKYFGVELAIGLSSACLISVILLPICIFLLRAKPGPLVTDTQAEQHVFSRVLSSFGDRISHHSGRILVVTCVLMAIMGVGITRINTDVDFVELLPEGSSPRRANDVLEQHFGGMYANTIYFQGDLGEPTLLAGQLYLENFLRSEETLSSFNSLNNYIAEENWLFSGVHAIPETRAGISNLWLLLESEEMMEMIVAPDRTRGLITSFIKGSATGKLKRVSERIREFLDLEVSDTVVRVDPGSLPPAGREALRDFRLWDAARQMGWLAERYGGEDGYDPSPLHERLREVFPTVEGEILSPTVLKAIRHYLDGETVEVLPDDLIGWLMNYLRGHWQDRSGPGFRSGMEQRILRSGIMDAEEANRTVDGLVQRADFSLRLQRTDLLWESLQGLLPVGLRQNEHFEKRTKGVLWDLLGDHPIFFGKQVRDIPGIAGGLIEVREARIRQAGFPEILARLEAVLLSSQYLSLLLASAAVFTLVSVTQLSLRRGLASLLSVLVPLELVLGIMGWFGIPLDFGTVLIGALIIGLGIDGSIHFLHYYHHLREKGIERRQGLKSTMGHVGRAVVTANATTSVGFLILLFAHTSALRNFAFTSGMAILLVTVSILTFLPALVVLLGLDKDRSIRRRSTP